MQEKPFHKLRISDINQKSYVSRATFYRLFDSLQDVLVINATGFTASLKKRFEVMKSKQNRTFSSAD
ncbi:MAG: hypothetical protein ACLT0Y_04305 [Christensenellales bacterium]